MSIRRCAVVFTWGLLAATLSSLGTLARVGAQQSHDADSPEGVRLSPARLRMAKIEIAPVGEREFDRRISATGEVAFNADRTAHVGPRIPGRIVEIYAFLGDRVTAGQPLLVLDSIELGRARAELRKARARMELAQRTYAREERLYKEEITSERETLEAQTAYEEARIDFEAAEEMLHILGMPEEEIDQIAHEAHGATLVPVTAPFAGIVVTKHAPLGEVVDPSTRLFTIADLSTVWVETQIYEKDLRFVRQGGPATVAVAAYPGENFDGTVTYLSDLLDETTRTVNVRVEVGNPQRQLRPGMFAEVRVSVEGHLPVLAVPEEAVQGNDGEWVVYATADGELFQERPIKLGDRQDGYVAVLDGLEPGERIVVKGGFLIRSEAAKEGFEAGHGD